MVKLKKGFFSMKYFANVEEGDAEYDFYEHVFITQTRKRLENEICISDRYQIYLKNLSNQEIQMVDTIFRDFYKHFVRSYENLEEFNNKSSRPYKDLFYCYRFKYGNLVEEILRYNIKKNPNLDQIISENDKNKFVEETIRYYMKDVVVVEVKDWSKINEMLKKYSLINDDFEISESEINLSFINKYIRFFSFINGERMFIKSDKVIPTIPSILSSSFNNNFLSVDNFIDDEIDELNFNFILEYMSGYVISGRRSFLDMISLLEFLVTNKVSNGHDEKVSSQFVKNICKLKKIISLDIGRNEIEDLYNYRSCLLHADYVNARKSLNKILKKRYYSDMIKKLYGELDCDISYEAYEEILVERAQDIFRELFKLYCKDKSIFNSIKKTDSKKKNFKFFDLFIK